MHVSQIYAWLYLCLHVFIVREQAHQISQFLVPPAASRIFSASCKLDLIDHHKNESFECNIAAQ